MRRKNDKKYFFEDGFYNLIICNLKRGNYFNVKSSLKRKKFIKNSNIIIILNSLKLRFFIIPYIYTIIQ